MHEPVDDVRVMDDTVAACVCVDVCACLDVCERD